MKERKEHINRYLMSVICLISRHAFVHIYCETNPSQNIQKYINTYTAKHYEQLQIAKHRMYEFARDLDTPKDELKSFYIVLIPEFIPHTDSYL